MAMSLFVLWRRPPPKWLAAAFVDAIMTDCKSWDEVFGRPPRRKKHWPGLLSKIRELKAKGVKGEALFKQAANELSLDAVGGPSETRITTYPSRSAFSMNGFPSLPRLQNERRFACPKERLPFLPRNMPL